MSGLGIPTTTRPVHSCELLGVWHTNMRSRRRHPAEGGHKSAAAPKPTHASPPRDDKKLAASCWNRIKRSPIDYKIRIAIISLLMCAAISTQLRTFWKKPSQKKDQRWKTRFHPIPDDKVGLPNVIYGCGNSPRQVDEIQIHVIGWRRSLKTLLTQLQNADYKGWDKDVPLYIHIDGEPMDGVTGQARSFRWTHGPLHVNVRKQNVGLRNMWLDSMADSARNAGNNTLLVTFEDDMRVSPVYFQWLLQVIDAYGRNPRCRDSNLVGFSLSPILLAEMHKPFTKWDAREKLEARYNNDNRHLAYLSEVPSSWGAAYWSNQWNQFDKFVRLRMQPPFYDAEAENTKVEDYSSYRLTPEEYYIPGVRSNVWPRSWKRFMVDFMYVRGLVMLYPCLPGQQGLATALQESGEHVGQQEHSFGQKDPRVADLLDSLNMASMGNLPRYGDLAVFDLNLKLTTREKLAERGVWFLKRVLQDCTGCEELVRLWARPDSHFLDTDIHENPRICVPDLYTPVSVAETRPTTLNENERYLLFEPQYGANNQLHSIIEAFYWARVLGRRLVLPPIFMPRVSEVINDSESKQVEIEGIFRVTDTEEPFLDPSKGVFDMAALEPITFTEFAKRDVGAPWRLIRLTHEAVFDTSARVLTSRLSESDVELVNVRHIFDKSVSIKLVKQYLGGCDDQVLAFDGMFFANLNGVNPRELMPDVLTLSNQAAELYDEVKEKFLIEVGSLDYSCYHVRLGDFTAMCDTLENPEEHEELARSLSPAYLRTAQEFMCSVTPEELVSALRTSVYPALIMSDKPQQLHSTLENVSIKYVASDWVEKTVRETLQRDVSESEMQLLSLLMDQELCSEAKVAVLNRFSTVSQRIISLRRGNDLDFWRRRVYSGAPQ